VLGLLFISVVVDDGNVFGVHTRPNEDDAPLLVDSDGVKLVEVPAKFLKVIRRGLTEVVKRHGSVDLNQTTQGTLLNFRVQLPGPPAFEKALGFLVPEALDHVFKVTGNGYFGDNNCSPFSGT
jgi:hypothetical protein